MIFRLFVSDCGKYVARRRRSASGCGYDVMTIDGSELWLDGRYEPKGWHDTDPRVTHPEFDRLVIAYGILPPSGRFRDRFELTFADMDMTKKVDPLTGNCIVTKYRAEFSRPISFRKPRVLEK